MPLPASALITLPDWCAADVRSRAFFDKRLAQEVEGDSLGDVSPVRNTCKIPYGASHAAHDLWILVPVQLFRQPA